MNEQEQSTVRHLSALQGERPYHISGCDVRRVSLESISVLGMIGSPFADAFGGGEKLPRYTPQDLVEFYWVHAEDPDAVLDLALQCTPNAKKPVTRAAMQFARDLTPAALEEALRMIITEKKGMEAAGFDAHAPEGLGKTGKKKE